MAAIKKTKDILNNVNKATNNSHILIARKKDARNIRINWKKYHETYWTKYSIKETDMRAKTATFTSPQYLDLTTGTYCVLITSKMHEDFGGIIINVEYDAKEGLYNYSCQDFSRVYQSKFELITAGDVTVHRILSWLITRGAYPLKGSVSKKIKKECKDVLSGLRPAYQYDQKYWRYLPSFINKLNKMSEAEQKNYTFNPMTSKPQMIIRNKSWIEAIRDIVYSTGAFIDVHFDKYGTIQLEPYYVTDLYQNGLYLTTPEIASAKYKFDTTNIITGVRVHSATKNQIGKYYDSKTLVNLDLSAIFGDLTASIDSNTQASTTTTTTTTKQSNDNTKTSNPYNTKKKNVYLTSDNIKGKSADKKFMNDIAKILKKNGWKTTVGGVGPNEHYKCKVNNGVWFTIFGGADAAVFKQAGAKNAYTNGVKSKHSRTVIGMHGGGDIRKGGKYYKYLPRAHDDNYSPSSFRGLSNPLNYLIKAKVPIMYADTASDMAAKFLAGGDAKGAL